MKIGEQQPKIYSAYRTNYPILQAYTISNLKLVSNRSNTGKERRRIASLSCDIGEQSKIYLAYKTNYPMVQAKPICTCGIS